MTRGLAFLNWFLSDEERGELLVFVDRTPWGLTKSEDGPGNISRGLGKRKDKEERRDSGGIRKADEVK